MCRCVVVSILSHQQIVESLRAICLCLPAIRLGRRFAQVSETLTKDPPKRHADMRYNLPAYGHHRFDSWRQIVCCMLPSFDRSFRSAVAGLDSLSTRNNAYECEWNVQLWWIFIDLNKFFLDRNPKAISLGYLNDLETLWNLWHLVVVSPTTPVECFQFNQRHNSIKTCKSYD